MDRPPAPGPCPPIRRDRATPWLAAAASLLCGSAPQASRAALDEFENWSIAARERDDENGLDDLQRSFAPWEDWRWLSFRNGARVGMGCATTEVWEINLHSKIRHPLGERAEVTFDLLEQRELGESVDLTEFGGSGWTSSGIWLGAFYRPAFAKELHSGGIFVGLREEWERRFHVRLAFEDMLNNFWERRTRYIVEKSRRVYEKRPLEWEVAGRWRWTDLGRVAWRAVWLPEYRRTSEPAPPETSPASARTSQGWLLLADLATDESRRDAFGLRARIKGTDRLDELSGTGDPAPPPVRNDARLRDAYLRPWCDVRLSDRWRLRGIAQARWSSERHHDGARDHVLETRHLGGLGTAVWSAVDFLDLEAGLGADRVRVEQDAEADFAAFTHGTRTELRAVFTAEVHMGGARLVLTETLEGDNEGYQTVGFHDKGFARLTIEF